MAAARESRRGASKAATKPPTLPGIRSKKLLAAYAGALHYLKRDYVTGVGVGYALKDGKRLKTVAVSIHVNAKRLESELTKVQLFPKKINGVRVDIVQVNLVAQLSNEEVALRRQTKADPLRPGVAVKTGNNEIGTLALLVRAETGEPCFLGARHVLEAGATVYQPNRSIVAQAVGLVSDVLPEPMDAGIVKYSGRTGANTPIGTNVRITKIRQVKLNDELTISGAFTGIAQAVVTYIGQCYVDYDGIGSRPVVGFKLEPVDSAVANLTTDGDSGALWFDRQGSAAVGLHVAGCPRTATTPSWAFACSIQDVTERLRVSL